MTKALLLGAVASGLLLAAAPARADYVYTPGAEYATKEGNINNVVFNRQSDNHMQWFFSSALFGAGPVNVNAVSFRFDDGVTNQYGNTGTFDEGSAFRVALGTVTTASTAFADNLANAQTVLSGARSIDWTVGAGPGQTKPWGVTLTFDHAFTYDPAAGMLMVDMYVPAQVNYGTFDFVTGDSRAFRLFNLDPSAATGSLQSFAPVARFDVSPALTAVPEPASWAQMVGGFGLLGMTARRRRFAAFAA